VTTHGICATFSRPAGETASLAIDADVRLGVLVLRGNGGMDSALTQCERDVKGDMEMMQSQPQWEVAVNARLLKIGLEVFPVYGDEKSGFTVDPGDLYPQMPNWFRYRSIDELFFALVNLNISPEGQA
jgi:hypothetical protein